MMTYLYLGIGACALAPLGWLLLRRYMAALVEKRVASYQNDLVARHCDEVENIYRQMRGWRHDYHNHIQAMKAYLALEQTDRLSTYLGELDSDLQAVDPILKTGNVMIDAILNSKISLARSKKIAVNAKAIVPKNVAASEVDLCVILGNLLDNAIEACEKLDIPARFIRVYVGTHKEMLYLSVSNAVGAEIRKFGGRYWSTKDSPTHGFGLIRIDRIAEKYNGFVDRQNEKGVFATEVMLPL